MLDHFLCVTVNHILAPCTFIWGFLSGGNNIIESWGKSDDGITDTELGPIGPMYVGAAKKRLDERSLVVCIHRVEDAKDKPCLRSIVYTAPRTGQQAKDLWRDTEW